MTREVFETFLGRISRCLEGRQIGEHNQIKPLRMTAKIPREAIGISVLAVKWAFAYFNLVSHNALILINRKVFRSKTDSGPNYALFLLQLSAYTLPVFD